MARFWKVVVGILAVVGTVALVFVVLNHLPSTNANGQPPGPPPAQGVAGTIPVPPISPLSASQQPPTASPPPASSVAVQPLSPPASTFSGKPYRVDGPIGNEIRITMLPPEMTEAEYNTAEASAIREILGKARGFTEASHYWEPGNGIRVIKADGTTKTRSAIKVYVIKPLKPPVQVRR